MARKTKPLSDTQIQKIKPNPDKEIALYDGDGLQLTVRKTGAKVFEFRYKSPTTQKTLKTTLGKYPLLTLAQARDIRLEYLKLIQNGIDPIESIVKASTRPTVASVATEYLTQRKESDAPNTYKRMSGFVARDLIPNLGDKPIETITRQDLMAIVKQMEARGAVYSSRRLINLVSMIWRYAMNLGYVEHNIATEIDHSVLQKTEVRNFAHTTDPAKLKEIIHTMRFVSIDTSTRLALFFALHTFLRPANVRLLEWSEIDAEKRLINIASEKMKMRRPHVVPISDAVMELIDTARKYSTSSQYVFATPRGKAMSDATLGRALERMGYRDVQSAHGFRHTASTILHENIPVHGIHSEAIERQLAHKDSTVRGVYNKAQYLPERTKLMAWWSEFVESL